MGPTGQSEAYTKAVEAIPSCTIEPQALELQRSRAARLSRSVRSVRRHRDAVVIGFHAGFDREALEEMVSVERECCPFLTFDFNEDARRLTVGVQDADHAPALQAMAELLGAEALEG